MKTILRLSVTGLAMGLLYCCSPPLSFAQPAEESHTHEEALQVQTEDPVLKEQILKVNEALGQIHEQMAQRRRAIQSTPDESLRGLLYAELDSLRKEHDMLERLLHDLVDEAKATEWTRVDEALRRARRFEQVQERRLRREDALRDRQDDLRDLP